MRERERESVCVCVRETLIKGEERDRSWFSHKVNITKTYLVRRSLAERYIGCVCERERERESVCVLVCERHR